MQTTWMYGQVVDADFMRSLRDTITVLVYHKVLHYCGFTLQPPSTCWPDDCQHPDHPKVELENELATNMGELAKELISSMMRTFMWLLRGWGATSIRFTSEKKKVAKDAATMFKQDLDAHKALKANATPELEPIIARSLFDIVPLQQMAAIVESTGDEVTAEVKEKYEETLEGGSITDPRGWGTKTEAD